MTKQQTWPQVHPTAKRMEQAGWEPVLAPIRISSPPHHRLLPLVAYAFICVAVAALVVFMLHFANGLRW